MTNDECRMTKQIRNPNDEGSDPHSSLDLAHSSFDISSSPDFRCQHNLNYWRNANWLAAGPGASGHIDGVRWKNAPHLGQYLASTGPSPVVDVEQLDASASLGERLMLGLRLMEGMDWPDLDASLDTQRRERIGVFVTEGLMERTQGRLRLTRRGLMIADSLLADLL